MSYIIAMLGLMAGCYIWIINAGAVAHAIRKWTGPVRDPATLARRFGFRRIAGAYSMRSPEEADLPVASAGFAALRSTGQQG